MSGHNQVRPALPTDDIESPPAPPVSPSAGRFKLSTMKIVYLIKPLLLCHILCAILSAIPAIPSAVISLYILLQALYVCFFIRSVLTLFSDSWAREFEIVENEMAAALARENETIKEMSEMKAEVDHDVHQLRESIGETKQYLQEHMFNPDVALKKVQKLDDKMTIASEIRQSRHFLGMVLAGVTDVNVKLVKPEFLRVSDLMTMVKRMAVCKCTLTDEEQSTAMIKLDARALRLVCHNFATFSRAMEAADSSYKGFCTVDVTLPSEIIPELNVVTQLEIRTKYMGMGLSESGIAEVQEEIRLVKENLTPNQSIAYDSGRGRGYVSPTPGASPTPGTDSKENSAKTLGLESFSSKIMWQAMAEGKSLTVAYLIAEVLGGTVSVKKDFGFCTIAYSMACPLTISEVTPKHSPENVSARRAAKSPNSTPPAIPHKIQLSNNVADIVHQYPENLKIVMLVDDDKEARTLMTKLGCDPMGSQCLVVKPTNVDQCPDVAMGLVEVDQKDDSMSRRLTPLEARMADVVILNENLGQDTKGRRWLSTSMAIRLDHIGFKGVVIVRTDEVDTLRLKFLSTAQGVHGVITKRDPLERVKVNILFAFADPSQAAEVKQLKHSLKRNNSFQRDMGSGEERKDPILVAHRISERRRRKSSENVPSLAQGGSGKTPSPTVASMALTIGESNEAP